jgi:probable HAF family extracellular repeat protein
MLTTATTFVVTQQPGARVPRIRLPAPVEYRLLRLSAVGDNAAMEADPPLVVDSSSADNNGTNQRPKRGFCSEGPPKTMSSSIKSLRAFAMVQVILLITVGQPSSAKALQYHLTDIGTLGGSSITATAINDSGQVVGYGQPTGDPQYSLGAGGYITVDHAFLFDGGTLTDLGTFGGVTAMALGINSAGAIVGGNGHAFLYSNGAATDIGAPSDVFGSNFSSEAASINATGQIAGSYWPISSVFAQNAALSAC